MILAGIVTAAILPELPLIMGLSWPASWLPALKVVVPVTILFGIPSFVIGCISPVIYRICIQDLSCTGRTVGRLAASGSLGSIAGTFATGFYLIPAMGTRSIVYCVAAGLVIMGIISFPLANRKVKSGTAAAIIIATLLAGTGPLQPVLRPHGIVESAYYTIKVVDSPDQEVGQVKKLILDSLIHSAARPDRPDYLWYEYEKVSAWLMQQVLNGESPTAFFIGGGGYTLPYWLENWQPRSAIEVAEIDPAVTRTALREFISPDTRIMSHNMDARRPENGIFLTDDYAPVDNLLLPIFAERLR